MKYHRLRLKNPNHPHQQKRARRGESTRGITFARRFRPKSSPAAERWDAITSMFETEIFLTWYGMVCHPQLSRWSQSFCRYRKWYFKKVVYTPNFMELRFLSNISLATQLYSPIPKTFARKNDATFFSPYFSNVLVKLLIHKGCQFSQHTNGDDPGDGVSLP